MHALGIPSLISNEIVWKRPVTQEVIVSDERISFSDTNTRLVMRFASLADIGTYTVAIMKEDSSTGVINTEASTSFELHVYGKHIPCF